jgi:hypothetical protein
MNVVDRVYPATWVQVVRPAPPISQKGQKIDKFTVENIAVPHRST